MRLISASNNESQTKNESVCAAGQSFLNFSRFFTPTFSGHWSVKQRPASQSVGRSVGGPADFFLALALFEFTFLLQRQLTSSRPTFSRQWSLVGPKIRPSGRENRVAQTSLQSVAYLLYSAAPMCV
ncbi:hypothetical protein T11_6212 [Trichinella zimbabwensis]|uniref:Uncharacterized protein n=1 Tax=Trichinella zimbabwensis TaxID=268475 RepID=A0A0V1GXU4_9BILA|nr:hypothetical protein T11_6212 [Trichinella zimbabwensis]